MYQVVEDTFVLGPDCSSGPVNPHTLIKGQTVNHWTHSGAAFETNWIFLLLFLFFLILEVLNILQRSWNLNPQNDKSFLKLFVAPLRKLKRASALLSCGAVHLQQPFIQKIQLQIWKPLLSPTSRVFLLTKLKTRKNKMRVASQNGIQRIHPCSKENVHTQTLTFKSFNLDDIKLYCIHKCLPHTFIVSPVFSTFCSTKNIYCLDSYFGLEALVLLPLYTPLYHPPLFIRPPSTPTSTSTSCPPCTEVPDQHG